MNIKFTKAKTFLIALTVLPAVTFAGGQLLPGTTSFSNALFNTLTGVIIFLLIVIVALSRALKYVAQSDYVIKKKQEEIEKEKSAPGKILGITLLCFSALSVSSQTGKPNNWLVGGMEMSTFYFMLAIIIVEVIFVILLLHTLHFLLRSGKPKEVAAPKKKEKTILEKLNASVDLENEQEILMDHDYDGIRELDNDLPPWWKYGFYLTVFVAMAYLIHYHITYTGDLQITEYNKEVEKGKADVAEFMKKSADNVDESTVKMMQGADIEAGKTIFINTCSTCHGKLGEGGVGPNLTDDYFLHGGSLSDIFKTIKYGWPDKGMKSWKEDLSPIQIAQISSFIKKLRGTNPPKAKAQQGDLYIEGAGAIKDSTAVIKDSIPAVKDTLSKLK